MVDVGGRPGQQTVVTQRTARAEVGLATTDAELIVEMTGIGPMGPTGPGTIWRGNWDWQTDYVVGDVVSYGGVSWTAYVDPPVGETPPDHQDHWQLVADKGQQGPVGPTGPQGPPSPTPIITPFRTNAWYGQPIVATSSNQPNEGVLMANFLWIPPGFAIAALIFEVVTTPGSAGALARLGVYRLNTNNVGGVLETDAGTSDVTALGQIEVPCAVAAKTTPWMAVMVLASQGGATTRATYRSIGSAPQYGPTTKTATSGVVTTTSFGAYLLTGVNAGLPGTFTTINDSTTCPRILLRGTQS